LVAIVGASSADEKIFHDVRRAYQLAALVSPALLIAEAPPSIPAGVGALGFMA
jgi:hypothetical protein